MTNILLINSVNEQRKLGEKKKKKKKRMAIGITDLQEQSLILRNQNSNQFANPLDVPVSMSEPEIR